MEAGNEFEKRYMGGHCDALAIALSTVTGRPIVSLHVAHYSSKGDRTDPDFLHVVVEMPDGNCLDAKGLRSLAEVMAEFNDMAQSLKAPEDEFVSFCLREYEDAETFVGLSGCNPEGAVQALTEIMDQPQLRSVMESLGFDEKDVLNAGGDLPTAEDDEDEMGWGLRVG